MRLKMTCTAPSEGFVAIYIYSSVSLYRGGWLAFVCDCVPNLLILYHIISPVRSHLLTRLTCIPGSAIIYIEHLLVANSTAVTVVTFVVVVLLRVEQRRLVVVVFVVVSFFLFLSATIT